MTSRTRRWVHRLAAALFCFVLFFFLVHTDPFRELARRGIASALSAWLGAEIRIEKLDYRLWRGEVVLAGVEVALQPPSVPLELDVDRIELDFSLPLELSANIQRPEITFLAATETTNGPPEIEIPWMIRHVVLREGRALVKDAEEETWLDLTGIELQMNRSDAGHELKLTTGNGWLTFKGQRIDLEPLEADIEWIEQEIRIRQASVRTGEFAAQIQGSLSLLSPFRAGFDVDYQIDEGFVQLWAPEWEVTGLVSGRARLELIDDAELHLEGDFHSEAVGVAGVGPLEITGQAALAEGALQLSTVSLRGYGGSAELGGRISLRENGSHVFRLDYSDLDLAELTRDLAGLELPITNSVSGAANVSLPNGVLDRAEGQGTIHFEPPARRDGIAVEGDLILSLAAGRLEIHSSDLATSHPRAEISVRGERRVDRSLEGSYEIDLAEAAELIDWLGIDPSSPLPLDVGGPLSARGEWSGTSSDIEWTSRVASSSLVLNGEASELSADFAGDLAAVRLDRLELRGERSSLQARGVLPLDPTSGEWDLLAEFDGLPLPSMESRLGFALSAAAQGQVRITGAAADPDWEVAASLNAMTLGEHEGTASVRFAKRGRELVLDELEVSLEEASLEGTGSYALDSQFMDGRLRLNDVLLQDIPLIESYLFGLHGRVSSNLAVQGPVTQPIGQASIRLDELTMGGNALPSLDLQLESEEGRIKLDGRRQDGPTFLVGEVLLEPTLPTYLEIDLAALPLVDLARGLGSINLADTSIEADGRLEIDLPLSDPGRIQYRALVDSYRFTHGEFGHQASSFRIDGDGNAVRLQGLELVGNEREFSVHGVIPLNAEGNFDLDLSGGFSLGALALVLPDLEATGIVRGNLKLQGTVSQPLPAGTVAIRDSHGSWMGVDWENLNASLESRQGGLPRLSITGTVLGGDIELSGSMPRFVSGTDEPGTFTVTVDGLDLGPLLWAESDGVKPELVFGANGTIELPRWSLEGVRANGNIVRFEAEVGAARFTNADRSPWHFAENTLSLPTLRLTGDQTDLTLSLAGLRLEDSFTGEASLRGTLDLELINPLLSSVPGMEISGPSDLDFQASYGPEGLSILGEGTVSGGRFVIPQPPIVLRELSARFSFAETTIQLADFTARAGGGRLHGEGTLDLAEVSAPHLDLQATAEQVRLQLMEGVRGQVSGAVRLQGGEGDFRLAGDLRLEQGLISRNLDEDRAGSHFQTVRDPSIEPTWEDELSLALSIETVDDLRVDNNAARLEAGATLAISGTVSSPELSGVLTLRPDGRINVGRNAFQIVSGRADFDGYPFSPPQIQGAGMTKVGQTIIRLDIDGEPDDLRTRLQAPEDPSLTEGDLVSLLLTGRTLENAGEGGTQMASMWALSSFADLVHEGLGDVFTFGTPANAGPLILAEEANPTSRFTLGFPLTEDFSVTYSIALDDTEKQLWILDYRIARDLWIRAIQEDGNQYTLGFTHRFSVGRRTQTALSDVARTEQQMVNRITFGGESPLAEDELMRHVTLRPGARFDYWVAQDDAQRLRQTLIENGYLSAVVNVEPEPAADGMDVRFVVGGGTPLEIVWEGDDPGDEIRQRTADAWDGRIPESFLLTDSASRATWDLRSRGYFRSEVEGRLEESPHGQRAIFDVALGPRGQQVGVSFQGNEALDDTELTDALPATSSPLFFEIVYDKQSELEKGLRLLYASRGYLFARAQQPITTVDPRSNDLQVIIPVEEGPLVRIESFRFEGATVFDHARLQETLGTDVGDPIDLSKLSRGEAGVRLLYRNEGFPDARLRTELQPVDDGLAVTLRILEGPRVQVGSIRIVGNLKTRPSVIRRELTFQEGDPLRLPQLQESQRNLHDLGIFRAADVRVDSAGPAGETRDVIVHVVERAVLEAAYGLRYNFLTDEAEEIDPEATSQGLAVVLRATFPNPMGRAATLGVTVLVGGKEPLLRGSLLTPRFFGRHLTNELFAEVRERQETREDRLGGRTQEWSVTFQQSKRLSDERFTVQWNYRFGRFGLIRLLGVDLEPLGLEEFRSRLGGSLIEDRRDSLTNPSRGRFWNLTMQVTPKFLGNESRYYRFFGQLFYFYPLGRSVVWASSYRLGLAAGDREFLIIDDRFEAGGANSIRGFKQNSLGPIITIEGQEFLVGGQAVVVLNQELRFPIYKLLHGGVFFDAGNVFPTVESVALDDFRESAGFGLRLVLPFGPLRLD